MSAVVCYINEQSSSDKRNLISLIKVPDMYLQKREKDTTTDTRWYLFNDFSISPIPTHEVVWFSLDWKIPCVLYYSSEDMVNMKTEVNMPLTRVSFLKVWPETHLICNGN